MFCTACGRQLQEEDRFCARCGQPVSPAASGADQVISPPAIGESSPAVNHTSSPQQSPEISVPEIPMPAVIRTSRSTAELHKPVTPVASRAPAGPATQAAHSQRRDSAAPATASAPLVQDQSVTSAVDVRGERTTESDAALPPPPRTEPTAPAFTLPPQRSPFRHLAILLAILLLVGAIIGLLFLSSTKRTSAVEVTLSPARAQVITGNALDFAASVHGSNEPEVRWSLQEGDRGGRIVPRGAQASGGEVSMLVVYIAPDQPGTYHLIATSKANPHNSASAEITVTSR